MNKTAWIIIGIAAVIIGGVTWSALSNDAARVSLKGLATEATLYKSPSCGCCGFYTDYLRSKGDLDVRVENMVDLSSIKQKFGVPQNLQSCHTVKIGGYFVEGHVPLEAIGKLLREKPDIAGIALPGMPAGSPGMLGSKTEPFTIYAVHKDGSTSEFMRV